MKKSATLLILVLISCQNNVSKTNTNTSTVNTENDVYDNIKAEYNLFGSWIIKNTLIDAQYKYEIYYKETEYLGIIVDGEYKLEKLTKEGDKFTVVDNQSGEYYIIDSDKNMKLFDKDGDLSSTGFIAVKK